MKKLTCEMCGSSDLIKQDGVFVCQSCGCKYSVEEARKMMIEGTVDVSGSTVKVDNTGLIDSYLTMAENALTADNHAEAEGYANKIIEIDPKVSRAWFIKGKASGWQTTGRNNRFSESIVNWINAYEFADEGHKDSLAKEICSELETIGAAIVKMHCNSFVSYRSDSNKKDIDDALSMVTTQTETLIKKTKIKYDTASFETTLARLLNSAAVEASNASDKDFGPDYSDKTRYAWNSFTSAQDNCLRLLDKAYTLTSDDDLRFTIAQNFIMIATVVRDSCSYKFESNGYSSGYFKDYSFTAAAKQSRTQIIKEWEIKKENLVPEARKNRCEAVLSQCYNVIWQMESYAGYIEYWRTHVAQKNALENEKQNLQNTIIQIQRQANANPLYVQRQQIQDYISNMKAQKSALGLFKTQERKAVQDQINYAKADLKAVSTQISGLENEVNGKIASVQTRIKGIDTELTCARGPSPLKRSNNMFTLMGSGKGISMSPLEMVRFLCSFLPSPFGLTRNDAGAIENYSKALFDNLQGLLNILSAQAGSNNSGVKRYVDDPNEDKIYRIPFTENGNRTKAYVYCIAKNIYDQIADNFYFEMESDYSVQDAMAFTFVTSYLLFNLMPSSDIRRLQKAIAEYTFGISKESSFLYDGIEVRMKKSGSTVMYVKRI